MKEFVIYKRRFLNSLRIISFFAFVLVVLMTQNDYFGKEGGQI